MRVLEVDDQQAIEEIIGRSLTREELQESMNVESLSHASIEVTRMIARASKQLALKFLREVVPNTRLAILIERLEQIIERTDDT